MLSDGFVRLSRFANFTNCGWRSQPNDLFRFGTRRNMKVCAAAFSRNAPKCEGSGGYYRGTEESVMGLVGIKHRGPLVTREIWSGTLSLRAPFRGWLCASLLMEPSVGKICLQNPIRTKQSWQ